MKFIRLLFAFFLCGSGHILKREYFRGLNFFVGFVASIGIIFFAFQYDNLKTMLFGLFGAVCAIFLWFYSFLDLAANNNIKKKKPKIKEKFNKDFLQGISFSLKGENDRAVETFKGLLKKSKKDPHIYFQLAKVYEKEGRKRKARRMYKKYRVFVGS